MDSDLAIRNAAIEHCSALTATWGDAVPAAELTKGFAFEGQQVKLLSWGRGIFKPEQLGDGPLTLVSSLGSSYADESLDGDAMLYDYAPESFAWANKGLKRLSEEGRVVVMLKQVKPKPGSEYMIFAPVLVTGFDDVARKFRLDLCATRLAGVAAQPQPNTYARRYAETISKARLHQAYFRRDTFVGLRQSLLCMPLARTAVAGRGAHRVRPDGTSERHQRFVDVSYASSCLRPAPAPRDGRIQDRNSSRSAHRCHR
jgi:putative restriction endonuclease